MWEEDPNFPGVYLFEKARSVHVTSDGKLINLEKEIGLSINIPKDSFSHTSDVYITIAAIFSGPFQVPGNLSLISPIFLVSLESATELRKEVEVKIQHNAYVESEEDYNKFVLLKGSTVPDYNASESMNPQYRLDVVEGAKIEMVPEDPNYVLVKLKGFSWLVIGSEAPAARKSGNSLRDHIKYLFLAIQQNCFQQGCTKNF